MYVVTMLHSRLWTLEHQSTLYTPAYLPARHDTHQVTYSVRSGVLPHGEGAHAPGQQSKSMELMRVSLNRETAVRQ